MQVSKDSHRKAPSTSKLRRSPRDPGASSYGPSDTNRADSRPLDFLAIPNKAASDLFLAGGDVSIQKIHVAPPLIEVIDICPGELRYTALRRPMDLV